eukprot:scaffold78714_cov33-Tisochrysis_lutea.AAC.6
MARLPWPNKVGAHTLARHHPPAERSIRSGVATYAMVFTLFPPCCSPSALAYVSCPPKLRSREGRRMCMAALHAEAKADVL